MKKIRFVAALLLLATVILSFSSCLPIENAKKTTAVWLDDRYERIEYLGKTYKRADVAESIVNNASYGNLIYISDEDIPLLLRKAKGTYAYASDGGKIIYAAINGEYFWDGYIGDYNLYLLESEYDELMERFKKPVFDEFHWGFSDGERLDDYSDILYNLIKDSDSMSGYEKYFSYAGKDVKRVVLDTVACDEFLDVSIYYAIVYIPMDDVYFICSDLEVMNRQSDSPTFIEVPQDKNDVFDEMFRLYKMYCWDFSF